MNKFLLTSLITMGVALASEKVAMADADSVVSPEDVAQLRERLIALSESRAPIESKADVELPDSQPESTIRKVMTSDITEAEFKKRLEEGKRKAAERHFDPLDEHSSVSYLSNKQSTHEPLLKPAKEVDDATELLVQKIETLYKTVDILEFLYNDKIMPEDIWERVDIMKSVSIESEDDMVRLQNKIDEIITLCAERDIDLNAYLRMPFKKPETKLVDVISESATATGNVSDDDLFDVSEDDASVVSHEAD